MPANDPSAYQQGGVGLFARQPGEVQIAVAQQLLGGGPVTTANLNRVMSELYSNDQLAANALAGRANAAGVMNAAAGAAPSVPAQPTAAPVPQDAAVPEQVPLPQRRPGDDESQVQASDAPPAASAPSAARPRGEQEAIENLRLLHDMSGGDRNVASALARTMLGMPLEDFEAMFRVSFDDSPANANAVMNGDTPRATPGIPAPVVPSVPQASSPAGDMLLNFLNDTGILDAGATIAGELQRRGVGR